MEDNNQENVQTQTTQVVNQEPAQDPRLIHPEIIGELRKEKIGKPLLVIELFLLFGIVFAGLPFINSQLNDENSKLYQLIHGKQVTVIQKNTEVAKDSDYSDGSKSFIISEDAKVKYKNVLIKKISLSNNGLKCTVSSSNGVVNLDELDYYFIILSPDGKEITSFKLTGKVDNVEKNIVYESTNFNYNQKIGYQGKIAILSDDDYPDISYPSYKQDLNGYSSFVCKKNERTITYKFKNNFLIDIYDEVKVYHSKYTDDEYTKMLSDARTKAENLGSSVASAEEDDDGFVFNANISYETDEYKLPETIEDYDYYPSNTLAKKIAYAQTSKGYDCE